MSATWHALPWVHQVSLRFVGGALLTVSMLVLGWMAGQAAQTTSPVVVAARDIPRGELIEAADLRLTDVRIGGASAGLIFGAESLDSLVGQRAARDIDGAALLSTADLAGQAPLLGAGESAVTLPLNRAAV